MSLHAIENDKMPAPRKLLGLFPNCDFDCNTICTLLQEQNSNQINVGRWTILSNKKSQFGTHIAFAVSEDQYEIVKGLDFKLYFGAARASFKDISENVSAATAQREDENTEISTMDITEVSDDEVTMVEKEIRNASIETDSSEIDGDAHQKTTDGAPTDKSQTDEQHEAQQPSHTGAMLHTENNIQQNAAQNPGAPAELNAETKSVAAQQLDASAAQTKPAP